MTMEVFGVIAAPSTDGEHCNMVRIGSETALSICPCSATVQIDLHGRRLYFVQMFVGDREEGRFFVVRKSW